MKKCLLLRFPDQREVFTHETNKTTLVEFAKSFGIKVLPVEANKPTLLDPDEIAKVFCDQNQSVPACSYRVILGNRGKMLQTVVDVRTYIETQLREGQTVRIKELHKHFSKHRIAVSTLYRHLDYVRTKLIEEGAEVEKVMVGCYRLV